MSWEEIEDILLFIGFEVNRYHGFVYKSKSTKWEINCHFASDVTVRFSVYYELPFNCYDLAFKKDEFDVSVLVKSIKFNCNFPEEELYSMILKFEREKKIKSIIDN